MKGVEINKQVIISKVNADSSICSYCQRNEREVECISCHDGNLCGFLGIACYEVDDNE